MLLKVWYNLNNLFLYFIHERESKRGFDKTNNFYKAFC